MGETVFNLIVFTAACAVIFGVFSLMAWVADFIEKLDKEDND